MIQLCGLIAEELFNGPSLRLACQCEYYIIIAHLKALGGLPGGAAREYSWRPGSRGVMGRRVDTSRVPWGFCWKNNSLGGYIFF